MPLRAGYRLSGRVYDQLSGNGIAAARIGFREAQPAFSGHFHNNPRARTHSISQKNGSFVLEGVPPGRITLVVSLDSYVLRELEMLVDDRTAPVEVGLSVGGTIAGRLMAADGATPVVCSWYDKWASEGTQVTNELFCAAFEPNCIQTCDLALRSGRWAIL